jgi:hypothetical protein
MYNAESIYFFPVSFFAIFVTPLPFTCLY